MVFISIASKFLTKMYQYGEREREKKSAQEGNIEARPHHFHFAGFVSRQYQTLIQHCGPRAT